MESAGHMGQVQGERRPDGEASRPTDSGMEHFGYRESLDRGIGRFGSFAAGVSYISILTGTFQLFYFGFGIAGPVEHCISRLREIQQIGIDRVVILELGSASDQRLIDSRAALLDEVMPALRATTPGSAAPPVGAATR